MVESMRGTLRNGFEEAGPRRSREDGGRHSGHAGADEAACHLDASIGGAIAPGGSQHVEHADAEHHHLTHASWSRHPGHHHLLTVEGLTPLIAEHDPNSFPSGHTSASFAAASAWCRTLPRRWMGVTAVVLAALMGFSRLYVGVHFPSDVLAGVLVGLFCGWLACLLWQRFAAWRGLEA